MDEPPILPPRDSARTAGSGDSDDSHAGDVNPFAPVDALGAEARRGFTNLPLEYWGALIVAMVVLIVLTILFGVALPGIVALVAAAIRVPMLQKRKTREQPDIELPGPLLLLMTSWVFMLAACFAAGIAFMVVCIPTGFVALSSGGGSPEPLLFLIFGLSGLAWLGTYILLLFLSLRLPV